MQFILLDDQSKLLLSTASSNLVIYQLCEVHLRPV